MGLGIAGVVVVEREELEAEATEHAQVKVTTQVEGETSQGGRGVAHEPEFFVVVRALRVFLSGFRIREGIFRTVFNGSELDSVHFDTEPKGERNIGFPERCD